MIYIKRFNLCFVEIPKTASSSLRKFLIDEVFNENVDYMTHHFHTNPELKNKVHINSRYILRNNLVPRSAKFIGVIREPFERQLSEYLYLNAINVWRLAHNKPYYFKEAYKKANSLPHDNINGLFDVNAIFQLQSSYINRNLNHEFWLYENLEDHIEIFKSQYNIRSDAYLPKINVTHQNTTTKVLIDEYYDDELKKMVRRKYAEDFKLYDELKNGRRPR